jgi:uncharacterized membrane protein YfcA
MLAIALLFACLMGITLGLLGGGGSILTVPILVYGLGLEAKSAIATSLLVVGSTSFTCVLQHARAGNVRWRTGLIFGVVAMAGAFSGGKVAAYVSGTLLLALFACLMLAAAITMLRGKGIGGSAAATQKTGIVWLIRVAVQGFLVGAFTGLVGAGGGFLVVPTLVVLGGVEMRAAIGTSLLVIAMNSFAGLVGYLGHVRIDTRIAAMVSGAAIVGSFFGVWLAARTQPAALRVAFGWFVLVMAAMMLLAQLPLPIALGLTGVLAVGVSAWWRWARGPAPPP